MWMDKKYCLLIASLFVCMLGRVNGQAVQADPPAFHSSEPGTDSLIKPNASTPFIIGRIIVEGNKRTKPYIIERELPFRVGDSVYLPDLVKGFEVGRQQLMNTALFNEVIISVKAFRGYQVDIGIEVKERWYIFPIPYVKAVDRNFQEFLKQGVGVDRLNYGFKFNYNNFTGRNDKLRIWLITGYTKQIQFLYEQPYADASLKHGYKIGFLYSSNKEINYRTTGNEQIFSDSLGGLKRWYAHVDYTYRPGLRTFNAVRLGFVREEVDTMVLNANPKYFLNNRTRLFYPELSYVINYYNVDYRPFPLTGWMGELSFMKRGINKDMNMWQVSGKMTRSYNIARKTWFAWQGQGILRFPFNQPFINQRMFGYQDLYLRGLENYVVDGVGSFLFRQTMRRELFNFSVPTYLRSRSHSRIPFKIYAKVFTDVGYVHNPVNPENSLTNRMLYTTGAGFDIVTFYDFIMRIDYSFNQLGENGLFLRVKGDF
jgi:outer membrane protein assembly factor BamA